VKTSIQNQKALRNVGSNSSRETKEKGSLNFAPYGKTALSKEDEHQGLRKGQFRGARIVLRSGPSDAERENGKLKNL